MTFKVYLNCHTNYQHFGVGYPKGFVQVYQKYCPVVIYSITVVKFMKWKPIVKGAWNVQGRIRNCQQKQRSGEGGIIYIYIMQGFCRSSSERHDIYIVSQNFAKDRWGAPPKSDVGLLAIASKHSVVFLFLL